MTADTPADRPADPTCSYCPKCGVYIPKRLDGERAPHDCRRKTPGSGLPSNVCVCPKRGAVDIYRNPIVGVVLMVAGLAAALCAGIAALAIYGDLRDVLQVLGGGGLVAFMVGVVIVMVTTWE